MKQERGLTMAEIKIDPSARALIFDVDGTLVDSMEIHYRAWQEVCREKGFEYPREIFYELAGIPTAKIIPIINKRLGLDLDVQETLSTKEKYLFELLKELKEIRPVADVVRRYYGKMPMSLGTGGKRDVARLSLEIAGLDQYFDIMVASEDVVNHKPAPDTFLKCAELMNVEPRYCQVFEDGDLGLKAAADAGMIPTDVRPYLND